MSKKENVNEINIQNLRHKAVKLQNKPPISDEFVKEHLPIVQVIASKIAGKSSLPTCVEFDDLISWGLEGLIKAYNNYDESKGSKFKTYAYYRIRGEIYDKIRQEWQYRNPNDYNEYRKRLQKRIAELTEEACNNSSSLNSNFGDYGINDLISNSAMVYLISLDTIGEIHDTQSENTANEQEDLVWEYIKQLPDRERQIIEMFYVDNYTQKEIALKLNCSRSKICRLHMQSLNKLRRKLKSEFP